MESMLKIYPQNIASHQQQQPNISKNQRLINFILILLLFFDNDLIFFFFLSLEMQRRSQKLHAYT